MGTKKTEAEIEAEFQSIIEVVKEALTAPDDIIHLDGEALTIPGFLAVLQEPVDACEKVRTTEAAWSQAVAEKRTGMARWRRLLINVEMALKQKLGTKSLLATQLNLHDKPRKEPSAEVKAAAVVKRLGHSKRKAEVQAATTSATEPNKP